MFKTITAADSPYILDPKNTESLPLADIQLPCDTTDGPIEILLPAGSGFPVLNLRVFVTDKAGTAGTNNITILPSDSDLINGGNSYIINADYGFTRLHMASPSRWTASGATTSVTANNGLTKTGNNIQLGGEIIATTIATFETGTTQPMGLFFFPADKTIRFGCFPNPADPTDFSGTTILRADGGIEGNILGNSKARVEVVRLSDGSGQIDLEVDSPDDTPGGVLHFALKLTPSLLTFGNYINGSEIYLICDKEFGIYGLGDLGGVGNGTRITIDDLKQLVKITKIPIYADDAAAILGGLESDNVYKSTVGGKTTLNIVP